MMLEEVFPPLIHALRSRHLLDNYKICILFSHISMSFILTRSSWN